MENEVSKNLIKEITEEGKVLNDLTLQLKKMNEYLSENEKKVVETFRKKVVSWGNGAHISMPKKYMGCDTIIKILKQEEDKK